MIDELALRYAEYIKKTGTYNEVVPLYNVLQEFYAEASKLRDADMKCCDAMERVTSQGVMIYHKFTQGCNKQPHLKARVN